MEERNEAVRLIRPAEKRWRISVAAIMALSFGALVLLSVGGVLALTVGANYRNTFDLLGARSALLVDAMEESLRAHLGRAQDSVEGIAALYGKGAFDIDDAVAMKSVLAGALVGAPGATGMLIYLEDGTYRGPIRQDGAETATFDHVAPTQVTAPEILAALEERRRVEGVQWGGFVTDDHGVYANVSVPLMRDGVRMGWVIAPVELATLSTITSQLSKRYATHAFILYDGNRVIADEKLAGSGEAVEAASKALVTLDLFGDPVLARFQQRRAIENFNGSARGVEISEITVPDDDPGLLAYGGEDVFITMTKMIPGYGPRPWVLGAYYTRGEVGDEVIRAWRSGVLGFAALVMAVLAAVLLGKRLARPVREIADQAQRVAGFELDQVTPLPRSRVRELDEQAVAFNAMLTGLRAFSTYIPRSLVAKLVRSGESGASESRHAIVTVMFTDIAGFTTMSESMEASAAATLLNHHFAILCEAVDDQGGTVDKFLGDGMMAFFGAPDRLKGHAAAAVRAAAAIRDRLSADNRLAEQEGRPTLQTRIGIHTGPVIVGNIGASDRVNYTIIGDTVNVSQRLQGIGKLVASDAETAIVVSGETASRLDERVELTSAGKHRLRGRGEPVEVFVVGAVADVAMRLDAVQGSGAA